MLKAGDTITYLQEVLYPARQKGSIGERRTVGKEISVYDANYLLNGGMVAPVEKETQKERRKPDGPNGGRYQESDHRGADQAKAGAG